jgi:hypothetical protein
LPFEQFSFGGGPCSGNCVSLECVFSLLPLESGFVCLRLCIVHRSIVVRHCRHRSVITTSSARIRRLRRRRSSSSWFDCGCWRCWSTGRLVSSGNCLPFTRRSGGHGSLVVVGGIGLGKIRRGSGCVGGVGGRYGGLNRSNGRGRSNVGSVLCRRLGRWLCSVGSFLLLLLVFRVRMHSGLFGTTSLLGLFGFFAFCCRRRCLGFFCCCCGGVVLRCGREAHSRRSGVVGFSDTGRRGGRIGHLLCIFSFLLFLLFVVFCFVLLFLFLFLRACCVRFVVAAPVLGLCVVGSGGCLLDSDDASKCCRRCSLFRHCGYVCGIRHGRLKEGMPLGCAF